MRQILTEKDFEWMVITKYIGYYSLKIWSKQNARLIGSKHSYEICIQEVSFGKWITCISLYSEEIIKEERTSSLSKALKIANQYYKEIAEKLT